MKLKSTTAAMILALLVCAACNGNKHNEKRLTQREAKERLIRINRALSSNDRATIEEYVERNSLSGMKTSETGLFYHITGDSSGKNVEKGDIVEYTYKISLLDSTICYKSGKGELKSFQVGHGGVESGLEEGILLMKQGQRAKFIMPPHLAHGLIGDGKHIPARSIIIYDIDLINVVKH